MSEGAMAAAGRLGIHVLRGKKRVTLWVVDRVDGQTWEFCGLFSTEDKAVEQCTGEHYFVAPDEVDAALPKGSVPWRGLYFPLGEGDYEPG